jgi:hypothetical protein
VEITSAPPTIDGPYVLPVLDEQADGFAAFVEHAGIHGKGDPLGALLQRRLPGGKGAIGPARSGSPDFNLAAFELADGEATALEQPGRARRCSLFARRTRLGASRQEQQAEEQ